MGCDFATKIVCRTENNESPIKTPSYDCAINSLDRKDQSLLPSIIRVKFYSIRTHRLTVRTENPKSLNY